MCNKENCIESKQTALTITGEWRNMPRHDKVIAIFWRIIPLLPFFYYVLGIYLLQNNPLKQPDAYIGAFGLFLLLLEFLYQPWNVFLPEKLSVFNGKIEYQKATGRLCFGLIDIQQINLIVDKKREVCGFNIEFVRKNLKPWGFHNFGTVYIETKYLPSDREKFFNILMEYHEQYGYKVPSDRVLSFVKKEM